MKAQEIIDLYTTGEGEELARDWNKILGILLPENDIKKDKFRDQFNGKHSILTDLSRKDEWVGKGSDRRFVKKTRNILTYQKKITNVATAFVFGKPVQITLKNQDESNKKSFEEFNKAWDDAKLDYFNRKIFRETCIETESAEIWNLINVRDASGKVVERKLRPTLITAKEGYMFAPHFDDDGMMDAFTMRYTVIKFNPVRNSEITRYKIFLDDKDIIVDYFRTKYTETIIENPFNKIRVVYYNQPDPEWGDVQGLIDRLENISSRHGDTNDYYGGPVLKVYGELKEAPDKSQDGKYLEFESIQDTETGKEFHGDAEYLTWDHSPESVKLEYLTLQKFIGELSQTPDLTIEQMIKLNNFSGVALKMALMDPLIKAMNKEEVWGSGMYRRCNILKRMLAVANSGEGSLYENMRFGVEFQGILPDNMMEVIDMLNAATGGQPVMSQKTAVSKNPLVDEPEEEQDQIEKEGKIGAGSFNFPEE